jgi:hypothetical protein
MKKQGLVILFSVIAGLVWFGCSSESADETVRNCVDNASLCKYARRAAENMRGATKAEHCTPGDFSVERQDGRHYGFNRSFVVLTRGTWLGVNTYQYTVAVNGTVKKSDGVWKVDYSSISCSAFEGTIGGHD